MQEPATLDATICPLCGQGNRCAMELEKETGVKQGPCWCTQVDFNRAVLGAIPREARGKACICQACATGAVPAP
jgi:hypothetical protein